MNKVDQILQDFLTEAGWTEPIKAGSRKPEISNALKQQLITHLIKENKFNRMMVIAATSMFCIIFLLGIFFGIYYRDQPDIMKVIFGGTFLTMISIITGLRKFWLQKSKMDLILTIVPDVPADQAAKLIETLLYGKPAK